MAADFLNNAAVKAFPDVISMIPAEYRASKAQRPSAGNLVNKRGKIGVNCSVGARGIAGMFRCRCAPPGSRLG
jgi:hypothetical protein